MEYEVLAAGLGRRIRQLRRSRRITQEKLSEATGLHPTHIRRIERGKTNPSLANLWRIAEALETTVPTLFDWNDDNEAGDA